jgi:hypothetical protein
MHGGAAPQVKRKAAQRLADAEARAAFAKYRPETSALDDPVTALLELAAEVQGWQRFLADRVSELETVDWRRDHRAGEQLHAMVSLYERSMDRAGRLLVDLGKLGLDERRVRLQEAQARVLMGVIDKVLDDVGLTAEQRQIARKAVPARLLEAAQPQDTQERPEPYTGPRRSPVRR